MKILMFKGYNSSFKDDTDVFYESLIECGHTVDMITVYNSGTELYTKGKIDIDKYKDFDILWAPYERETIVALEFNKILKKPLMGHYEWAPPWRIGLEPPKQWGYEKDVNFVLNNEPFFTKLYKFMFNSYIQCDVKTIPDDYCLSTIEKLNNKKVNGVIRKPNIIDDENLLKEEDKNIKEKYQILTIARLVPHKRVHHIIKALAMIKNPPHYKIIGTGEEQNNLEKFAKLCGVSIEFIGAGNVKEKAIAIQESMFMVNIWGMLPFFEAALFKKPCITYKHPYTQNMLGKMPVVAVENNNTEKLAKAIITYINNPNMVKADGLTAHKSFLNNEASIYTKKEAVKKLMVICEKMVTEK